jgi:hypothetical protein
MRRRFRIESAKALFLLFPLLLAAPAFAVSCATQSQMNAAQRSGLEQAARQLAINIKGGKTDAVRTETIAAVASQFGGIAQTIQNINGDIQNATLTIDGMYVLDATDLKAPTETQFFCGVAGSPLTVEVTIPNLPPGKYALTLLHATGVQKPQQLSLVLQNDPAGSSSWKLAGFFTKPMTMAGHGGLWYWKQAREYASKNQDWPAWFYYQTAQFLLQPVDFISSPNLEKLHREAEKTRPGNMPGMDPMRLTAAGRTFEITNIYSGEFGNNLDLIVDYQGTPGLDPVAARAQVTGIMQGILQQHSGVRDAFHGIWVHSMTANNQQTFALELPMDQIPGAPAPPVPARGE